MNTATRKAAPTPGTHQLLHQVILWTLEAAKECVDRAEFHNETPDPDGGMGLWQSFQARFPKTEGACTAEVFAACIELTPAAKRAGNDIKGRAWDVLWMLKNAVRRAAGRDRVSFRVLVVRDRVRPTPTDLVAVCGPGDHGEPVITISFPGQD